MSKASRFFAILITGQLVIPTAALAVRLVTLEEARLPKAPLEYAKAGLTRGPAIEFDAPTADSSVRSPVRIVLRFVPFGGSTIDPEKITLTYLSQPHINLTGRVKSYITPSGISIPDAELPPGTHPLQVQVTDSKGRQNKKLIVLKVSD